ncbi:MAG: D-lyxose/D-mannose family sugar isomerase [Sphaerochaetaceae bacterium]|jgi:D-lyxose ketol-isomerase|nr:D-lyxose/D-mannose family sugar isomerase [Sphaerochaetaceae bacterium]MDX9809665.1 D-lyxose/D-mannose family sugar isomerase [Sphaerochaetaceae bacterium]
MISQQVFKQAVEKTLWYLDHANIVVTEQEKQHIEVADFGLGDLERIGIEVVTYINTDRVCAKELVLFPFQTCPEHYHPVIGDYPGKEETFRCRWGKMFLYVEGTSTQHIHAIVPEGIYTVFHEIVLHPGEQYTIKPNTRHWFQSGPEGGIVSEFSTPSFDDLDIFIDPRIQRKPEITTE